jgi:hypothetical protein
MCGHNGLFGKFKSLASGFLNFDEKLDDYEYFLKLTMYRISQNIKKTN